ncbi:MAG TPA: adenine deaminase C-terminal domain-containing protein [bacterium]|nr:adenine deaminase C-terminal domain-containing protein [bacterium]
MAAGRQPADRYLESATLLNVYSGELYRANVAIAGGRVAYVGSGRTMVGPDTDVLTLAGKVLAPGYIDPHTHITGMVTPVEFAREVLRTGTTALVADTLQIQLQTPPELIVELLARLSAMPVHVYWFLRPDAASPLPDETMFSIERLTPLLEQESVRAVGEVTRWPDLYRGDEDLFRKIALAFSTGRRIEGHAPGASPDRLVALAAAGWSADHEAITPDEALARLRAGIYTMLRHSSLRPDLPALAQAVTAERAASARLMLTTDGPETTTIAESGYMDHVIRQAIASGIPPIPAYQMATLNPATYFDLDEEIGGIGPGRRADIAVLDDLRDPTPSLVLAAGEIAVRDRATVATFPDVDWPRYFPRRIRPDWHPRPELFETTAGDLAAAGDGTSSRVPASPPDSVSFPVMHLENSVITRRRDMTVPVRNGVLAWPSDVVRLALLDPAGRWITNGALSNFVTRLGGMASSFNVNAHLIVLGQDPADMAHATRRVLEIGGGIVAVERGTTLLELPLPIAGVMSPDRLPAVADQVRGLYAFLRARGYAHADPHYSLLFLPIDSLPDVRVTYRGVWDVRRGETLVPRRDLPSPA